MTNPSEVDKFRMKEFYLFYNVIKAERHAAQAPALRERLPQRVNIQYLRL